MTEDTNFSSGDNSVMGGSNGVMVDTDQYALMLSSQEVETSPNEIFEKIIELFKNFKDENANEFIATLSQKGIEVLTLGKTSEFLIQDIGRDQIRVTNLSDSVSRLEFTALEVSLPDQIETRIIIVDGPFGVPIPVVQTRQKYRRLEVTLDLDRNNFASRIPGFNLTQSDLVEVVIAFIVCLLAAAILIAALTLLLVTGPVSFGLLMGVFLEFAAICAGLIIAVGAADAAISSFQGSTNSPERWGDWG